MNELLTIDDIPVEAEDGLFPALLAGIQEFRDRLEGNDAASNGQYRARILALPTGVMKRVTVAVLEGLRAAFEWLHQALLNIDDYLVFLDVVLAFIEVFGASTEALGDALADVGSDPALPSDLDFIGDIAIPIQAAGSAIAAAPEVALPNLIPQPGVVLALVAELAELVGDEPATDEGSLDAILAQLNN